MGRVVEDLGARLADVSGRVVGAVLRFDERLVNRHAPPVEKPIDTATIPWAAALEARWNDVRAELDALLDAGVQLPETDELVGMDQGTEGRWTTYILAWYGSWLDRNCERCPATTALLAEVPDLQIAGFTVLHPHSHLPLHQGPAKSLRYHLGVKVPDPDGSCRLRIGDEIVPWRDGESLAFDDRTRHEAWNDSDEARYVLFVQVAWPLGGVPGRVHRLTSRTFGRATRRIPRRAKELDLALNGGSAT